MNWLVILDFDGTFTVLSEEFPAFKAVFLDRIQAKTGLPTAQFDAHYDEQRRAVLKDFHAHGWRFNGHIVVAPHVDPYVELRTVSERVLSTTGAIRRRQGRQEELDNHFADLNRFIVSTFKPETVATLSAIERSGVPAYFASNSNTNAIRRKLSELSSASGAFSSLAATAYGHARKYVVTPDFKAIPARYLRMPGLRRYMHPRRSDYYLLLNTLRTEHNLPWERVFVVGDIFEADLLMPLVMGATVALVDHDRVPEYEREFIRRHPRAHLLRSPSEILPLIGLK